MKKTSKPLHKTEGVTGTYVYDKKLKKVVKVSSDIPKVSARDEGAGNEDMGPCGRPCAGGTCPMREES